MQRARCQHSRAQTTGASSQQHLLLRNAVQVPALLRQSNVLHVPLLDARVWYVLDVAHVESLGHGEHLGGLALVDFFVEVLELAAGGVGGGRERRRRREGMRASHSMQRQRTCHVLPMTTSATTRCSHSVIVQADTSLTMNSQPLYLRDSG